MRKFYLISILFLALILRISVIRFGLPSKNLALTTYNPDEPLSYYTIEKWNPRKLDFHPHRAFLWGGFHLYPLAASLGLAKIFGCLRLGNREFYINNLKEADKLYLVGRFLMVLFAVGSVFLIFLILKESYNESIGLLGGFLLAITPAHIFNSIYVRPDIMMMFFVLVSLYFAVKLLKTSETKFYLLSSIFVGLATGTKLSGAVYGIAPIIAHFLSERNPKERLRDLILYLIPIICLVSFCISSPYVIIDFNRTSESFLSYLKINLSLARGTMDFGQYVLSGTGIMSYLKHYLPYGLGIGIVIGGIIGSFLVLFNIMKNKDKFDLLFLISGLVIFFVISSTKNQIVCYTFPVVPFFIIYSIRGFDIVLKSKKRIISILGIILLTAMFSYTILYSLAYLKLYSGKNIREEVSEWIEKNIPKESSIAIARSYFWTPGILRQYNPPYKLLMGGDPINSSVDEAFLGLEKILPETDYLVLTEYEYRNFIHPKLKKYFLEQARIIDKIFSETKFKKIAEFDKEAKFLWFTFKKNYPPIDWLIPNPKIIVFEKK